MLLQFSTVKILSSIADKPTVGKKVKITIGFVLLFSLSLGIKTSLKSYESCQIRKLTQSIKNKEICASAENIMECSHEQFLHTARFYPEPLLGQEFLINVVKSEIEKTPEKARFLKDQYYIFTADLYIRSLTKRQKSVISYIPLLGQYNLDIQLASAFRQGMSDYSNEREVNRTIASETILQEVSNFNASLDALTKIVEQFH